MCECRVEAVIMPSTGSCIQCSRTKVYPAMRPKQDGIANLRHSCVLMAWRARSNSREIHTQSEDELQNWQCVLDSRRQAASPPRLRSESYMVVVLARWSWRRDSLTERWQAAYPYLRPCRIESNQAAATECTLYDRLREIGAGVGLVGLSTAEARLVSKARRRHMSGGPGGSRLQAIRVGPAGNLCGVVNRRHSTSEGLQAARKRQQERGVLGLE